MSSPSPSRPNLTNVVAACILSGGLIASAVINSHKPAPIAATGIVAVSGEGRAPLSAPPISKEAITAQVTAQIMASPELRNVTSNGAGNGYDAPLEKAGKSACKLMGVTVEQIEYSAKDDTFAVTINATFQPVLGQPSSGTPLISRDILTLRNDGYNNYIDEYYLRGTVNNATGEIPVVHLTVR